MGSEEAEHIVLPNLLFIYLLLSQCDNIVNLYDGVALIVRSVKYWKKIIDESIYLTHLKIVRVTLFEFKV